MNARRRTRFPLLALFGTLFLALTVVVAPAAQAHDQLVSSTPEDGAELEQAPAWLEFEFSGEIQEMGSEIKVTHDGEDVSAGEIAVDGTTMKSALPDDLGAGEYEVAWRVTSSDGHPIDGTQSFTVTDGSDAGGEVASTESAAGNAGLGAGAVDDPTNVQNDRGQVEATDPASDTGLSTPMIVLLSVAGVVVVGMVVLLLLRKKKLIEEGLDAGNSDKGNSDKE